MKKKLMLISAALLAILNGAAAHDGPALRRPISPAQPAWIIHIDVWNQADPQKIIDLIPGDIRPYVIFNISTSATDATSPDGPAVYDSWMKVCAQNRVWTMIQCSSGAHNRMPDNNVEAYRKYFEQYPNFLGYNFAEQFWDFGQNGCPTFTERLQLFADLLPICHEFGGYLAISFTQAYYSASMMPMAYMKRNTDWRNFIMKDKEHFLCFEKYTMSSCFYDIESSCLGAYLGGYAGQYGIRFDRCGWQEQDSRFVTASGAIPIMEHMMLTGQTMIDGPELITYDSFRETSVVALANGFKSRRWEMFPQMVNINVDQFRKLLDGTVRIPTRREVIDRTKVAVQNDLSVKDKADDNEKDPYITPATLYDGLYRHDCDYKGTVYDNPWLSQRWWFKKTGRYPAIPSLNALLDDDARRLMVVKRSQYDSRWGTVARKVAELDGLFPVEYTGDIYAARHENAWMTYNPYQYDETTVDTIDNGRSYVKRHHYHATRRAVGRIPLQYNTAGEAYLSYAPYSMGVMKEYPGSVAFYLTNYRVTGGKEDMQTTDTIRISGITEEPAVAWADRASHSASTVETAYAGGVLTIAVKHNGPLDLTVTCKGAATDRKTEWTQAVLEQPAPPAAYLDTLQLEFEHADYKNVASVVKNGYGWNHDGCQGLGFVELGTATGAMLNDSIDIEEPGNYTLILRYEPATAEMGMYYVYANGKRQLVAFTGETGSWNEYAVTVSLNKGRNRIGFGRTASSPNIWLDCLKLVNQSATTGVRNIIPASSSPSTVYYDLSGRRVSSPQRGVYICKEAAADGRIVTRRVKL